jgi:hypothetical protein
MKWFSNWFDKKVHEAWNRANQPKEWKSMVVNEIGGLQNPTTRGGIDMAPTLNFRMYNAESGWIMAVSRNDRKTDRHTEALHIINDSDDMGESIAHIITMETMRA